jgi:hypothetical protein
MTGGFSGGVALGLAGDFFGSMGLGSLEQPEKSSRPAMAI